VPTITATAEETPPRQRRLRRDTYLAAAAGVLAVGYLLNTSDAAYTGSWSFPLSLVLASHVLSPVGLVARAVGFILVTVAFLAVRSRRDGRLTRASRVIAGGFCASSLGWALYLLALIRFTWSSQESFSVGFWTGQGAQLAFYLLAAAAALLVASAFARENNGARRNRLLAWASVTMGAGFGSILLYDLVVFWGWFSDAGAQGATRLGADLFSILAAVVAALGFFAAAKPRESPSSGLLARRERVLAYAASSLVISYLLEATSNLIFMNQVGRAAASLGDHSVFTSYLLNALVSLAFMVASLLALVGFIVSSRSLVKRDKATYRPAE
jgi:MFS family permease